MLVSISVLVVLIAFTARIVQTASTISNSGSQRSAADSQARTVFSRMAIDLGQMLQRTDVDYYLKQNDLSAYPGHSGGHGNGNGKGVAGTDQSDQMAFFSQVPGYYPSTSAQSPLSLVGYRVNATSYQLERLGKGLLWNGASNLPSNNPNASSPLVFLPLLIKDTWPPATLNDGTLKSQDADYEAIGPLVFRFEYYYLMKSGDLSDTPWLPPNTTFNGLKDVEAIAVTIAVADSKSRSLLTTQNITDLAAQMNDFRIQNGKGPVKSGVIEAQWNSVIINNPPNAVISAMPRAAVSAIRVYSRYFSLHAL